MPEDEKSEFQISGNISATPSDSGNTADASSTPAPPAETPPPVTGDTKVAEPHAEGPAPSGQVGSDTIAPNPPASDSTPAATDAPAADAAPATDAPKADAPATDTPAADKPADPAADKSADPPIGVVQGGEGNPDVTAVPASADGEHDPPHGLPTNGIKVTQYNRRSEADLIEGQYVDIVSGEHAGRSGAYLKTVAFSEDTGYPSRILVRTDDDEYEFLVENVSDCKHKASVR